MQIKLDFAELHSPIFMYQKSFPPKLYADGYCKHATGLTLVYDRTEKELLVTWNGPDTVHKAIVPNSNIANMWPAAVAPTDKPTQTAKIAKPVVAQKMTAQVETPTDHVFAGPGKGKR